MEPTPSSERDAANRCDGDRHTVRNGVRTDGEWEHPPVSGEG